MKTKRKLKPWVIKAIIIISLLGVIYSSYKIITRKIHLNANNKIQESIVKNITIKEIPGNKEEYSINFKSLKERNKDTVAYLEVNNTNIDYIVVKGTDNSYYLNHNFDKKWNVAGWIFVDYRNKLDGLDKNIIIYGHNIKDGSMFDSLKNTLNKSWYENKDNHTITLVTENNTYKYIVFSTYSITPEDYYIKTTFSSDSEYKTFLNTIKSRSIYNYNVDISTNNKILTLSSCIGDGSKRVVLHAKLEEDNNE